MSSRDLASNISFGSVAYCLGGNLFSYNYNSSFRLATALKPPLQGVWEQPARPVQRETLIHSLFNRKEIKVCVKKLSRRPNIRSFTVIFNFPFGSRKKTKTIKNNYYPEKSSPWAFHLWNSLVNDPFSVVCPPFLYNFPAHSFSVKLNLPTQVFFNCHFVQEIPRQIFKETLKVLLFIWVTILHGTPWAAFSGAGCRHPGSLPSLPPEVLCYSSFAVLVLVLVASITALYESFNSICKRLA